MSAALTLDEVSLLTDAVTVFDAAGGRARAVALSDLAVRLGALRHCDQCGVLFEGLAHDDECPHCVSDRRFQEAREARGEHL